MSRGILTIEPRHSGSLLKLARMVIPALAGSPDPSVPSTSDFSGFEMKSCLIDAEGEWVMEQEAANQLQDAHELQIAHAFGPLRDQVGFQRVRGQLCVSLGCWQILEGDSESGLPEILGRVRDNWIRCLWLKRRGEFCAALERFNPPEAVRAARSTCKTALRSNPLPRGRIVTREMKRVLSEPGTESPWLQDLEKELINMWWTKFLREMNNSHISISVHLDDILILHPYDIMNHICAKLRARSKANPRVHLPLLIEVGDLWVIASKEEVDVLRNASAFKDLREKWLKISSLDKPPGTPQTMVVYPTRDFSAALDIFFSILDNECSPSGVAASQSQGTTRVDRASSTFVPEHADQYETEELPSSVAASQSHVTTRVARASSTFVPKHADRHGTYDLPSDVAASQSHVTTRVDRASSTFVPEHADQYETEDLPSSVACASSTFVPEHADQYETEDLPSSVACASSTFVPEHADQYATEEFPSSVAASQSHVMARIARAFTELQPQYNVSGKRNADCDKCPIPDKEAKYIHL